ncbi:hypothetical protein SLEP1_g18649 [Rubroshorea leprosula]|uniref:Uncharacterized protein n=1 Tax=Rubroshorea leprosula TaxID=152421 RepID=A0AAV5J5W4_9ROSI|nr:hypothetical protein SLEP1_g18649 [Rubroshorea leprosula]
MNPDCKTLSKYKAIFLPPSSTWARRRCSLPVAEQISHIQMKVRQWLII